MPRRWRPTAFRMREPLRTPREAPATRRRRNVSILCRPNGFRWSLRRHRSALRARAAFRGL